MLSTVNKFDQTGDWFLAEVLNVFSIWQSRGKHGIAWFGFFTSTKLNQRYNLIFQNELFSVL